MSLSRPQKHAALASAPVVVAPSPPPPVRPHTISLFCPHLQIESIGVLRSSGQYYFYCFDYTQKKFQPLECLGCQPEVTERDLCPLYAEYCSELKTQVCFAYNYLSCKVEQFVFQHSTGGFQEVSQPKIVHDMRRPLADILCVVKETEEYGMAIIQRGPAHKFKKSRAFNGEYLNLPPVRVRTLMVQNLENIPMTPIETDEFRPPFPTLKNQFNFFFQCCPRYPGIYVVGIRQEDQSMLRLYFSEQTGDFHPVTCPECTGPVTENFLRPLYAAYSDALGEFVIFVENRLSFYIEQYVFCKLRWGFNQVEDKDLVFDQKLIENGQTILKVVTANGSVYVSRDGDGFLEKLTFEDNRGYQKVSASQVKTLAIQKKEAAQKKMSPATMVPDPSLQADFYRSMAMLIREAQQRNEANGPAPVTATPESKSEDSKVDSEADAKGSRSGESESGSNSAGLEVTAIMRAQKSNDGYSSTPVTSESATSESADSDSEVDDESDFEESDSEESESGESGSESEFESEVHEQTECQRRMLVPTHPAYNPLALHHQYMAMTMAHAHANAAKAAALAAVTPESESEDSEVDDESEGDESDSGESGSEESEVGSDFGSEDATGSNNAVQGSGSESNSESEITTVLQNTAEAQKKIEEQCRLAVARQLLLAKLVQDHEAANRSALFTDVQKSESKDSKVDEGSDSRESETGLEPGFDFGDGNDADSSDGSFEIFEPEASETSDDKEDMVVVNLALGDDADSD